MIRQMVNWEWNWGDPRSVSMLLFMMSICVMFLTSSFAHLLNCISFRARHICFCSDYAAIIYYTVGCALVNAATIVPNLTWEDMYVGANTYLSINLMMACLILLMICETRMPNAKHKYLFRTLSFVAPFFMANYPFFKMYLEGDQIRSYFDVHVLSLAIGAIFNVTKYPEKLFSISNVFLSHHFMHIGTAIGVYANYYMCLALFKLNKEPARYDSPLQTFISLSITALFTLYIYYFSLRFITTIKPSDYIRKDN